MTHLAAELAGLGWRLDAHLVFSGRHAYLGVAAVFAVVAAVGTLLAPAPGDRRAQVRALTTALPYGGEGPGFVGSVFAAQIGFFVASEFAEGFPLRGADIAAALAAAMVAALLGAAIVAAGKRRMLEFVLALVWAIRSAAPPRGQDGSAAYAGPPAPAARCTPFAFRYRPPPRAA